MSSSTAEPTFTCVPAAGFELITPPAGTLPLAAVNTDPSAKPVPVRVVVAAACVCPVTSGTATVAAWPFTPEVPTRLMVCTASGELFRVLSLKTAVPVR